MIEKLKRILINIFHIYLILSFIRFIGWSLHIDNYPTEFQISLILTLISGFYWYYKGYISKLSNDEEEFYLLGKRKK